MIRQVHDGLIVVLLIGIIILLVMIYNSLSLNTDTEIESVNTMIPVCGTYNERICFWSLDPPNSEYIDLESCEVTEYQVSGRVTKGYHC